MHIKMDSDELTGLIASFLSALSFGSYGVPMKGEAATRVDVDPLVFMSYNAVTMFVSCFLPYFLQSLLLFINHRGCDLPHLIAPCLRSSRRLL